MERAGRSYKRVCGSCDVTAGAVKLDSATFYVYAVVRLGRQPPSLSRPDMHIPALAFLLALAGPVDTVRVAPDSALPTVSSRLELPVSLQLMEDTTPRRRRKSIEVSEWYERRLRIHRYGAYTMIPLFTFQAIAGNQLYNKSSGAPGCGTSGILARCLRAASAARFTPCSCSPPTPASPTPASASRSRPRTAPTS